MEFLRQLARVLCLAVRCPVLSWAGFIFLLGMMTALDPGALDSEPQEHAPLERLWGVALVAISTSWIVSPRLARRGFRRPAIAILSALPLAFLIAVFVKRMPDLAELATRRAAFRDVVLAAAFYFMPAFLTILEILANPRPILIYELFGKWRDSTRLEALSLR